MSGGQFAERLRVLFFMFHGIDEAPQHRKRMLLIVSYMNVLEDQLDE